MNFQMVPCPKCNGQGKIDVVKEASFEGLSRSFIRKQICKKCKGEGVINLRNKFFDGLREVIFLMSFAVLTALVSIFLSMGPKDDQGLFFLFITCLMVAILSFGVGLSRLTNLLNLRAFINMPIAESKKDLFLNDEKIEDEEPVQEIYLTKEKRSS